MHVARKLAAELDEGVVVAVLADAGWKYLSAPFWETADAPEMEEAVSVVIRPIRAELEEHARAEEPNEACGLVVLRDGTAERYLPARNAAARPYRFELDTDPPERARDEG